jgi:serine/threonine-protein kinase
MITGKLPFMGDYEQAVIYSILNDEPEPPTALRSAVPMALDGIIGKALAKDPAVRYQHVDELPADLKGINLSASQVSRITPGTISASGALQSKPAERHLSWAVATLLALLAACLAGILVWTVKPEPNQPEQFATHWEITLPYEMNLGAAEQYAEHLAGSVAISPNGKRVVFRGVIGDRSQLYLRSVDQFNSTLIKGTEGARNPFFSPDGEWLGFVINDKLMKVALAGGPPVSICDVQYWPSAYWASDGNVYFQRHFGAGISRVSASGGAPEAVTELDHSRSERHHREPEVLPDGKSIVFTILSGVQSEARHIAVQSLENGARKILFSGSTPHYLPTGHLVYESANTLMAVPFDSKRLEVSGMPAVVLDQVDGRFRVSLTGTLVYPARPFIRSMARKLIWVNRQGEEFPILDTERPYYMPKLSPDGKHLAVSIRDGSTYEVWTLELQRPVLNRVTSEGSNAYAIWTPDQQRLTFTGNPFGPIDVFWRSTDARGSVEKMISGEYPMLTCWWSPDGSELLVTIIHPTRAGDISVFSKSDNKLRPLLETQYDEYAPALSPDGRWIAYISNESGNSGIYVQSYPDLRRKYFIAESRFDLGSPVWGQDGREIFYLDTKGDAKMMVVSVGSGSELTPTRPRKLFEGHYVGSLEGLQEFDVSADGKRFVMIKSMQESVSETRSLRVILNWFEDLKNKVPVEN